MKNNITVTLSKRLFMLLFCLLYLGTSSASALPFKQLQLFKGGILNFDTCEREKPEDKGVKLKDLPVREKLAQMLMPSVATEGELDIAKSNKLGGVFIKRDSVKDLSKKLKEIKKDSEKPMLISIDGEGGTVGVPIDSDPGPANELGRKGDEEVQEIAKKFGKELSELGINMNLAPVADVNENTSAGVIKTRSFGNDKKVVEAKAKAFAEGLKESKVLPTFKHFPGHGHATKGIAGAFNPGESNLADSHKEDAYVLTIDDLKKGDMTVFKKLASTPHSAIMTGQLIIPGYDNNLPATMSKKIIGDLIRKELRFNGLVISDDMNGMQPVKSRTSSTQDAVLKAIQAGNDIVLYTDATLLTPKILDHLEKAVEDGTLTEKRIDQSITRIKSAKDFVEDKLTKPVASGCNCQSGGGGSTSGGGVGKEELDGHKIPATTGGAGIEEAIDASGRIPSGGAVTFSKFASKGQPYQDFYITMRWRYAKWAWSGHSSTGPEDYAWYSNGDEPRKVLVTNPETGKSIIAGVLEAGPAPWTGTPQGQSTPHPYWNGFVDGTPDGYNGRVAGFPPAAIEALGMEQWAHGGPEAGGSGHKLQYGWADDQNAVPGPAEGGATTTSSSSSSTGSCSEPVTGSMGPNPSVQSDPTTACASGPQPGSTELSKYIIERWNVRDLGVFLCRSVRGGSSISLHGEGRAFDAGLNVSNADEKLRGDDLFRWASVNAANIGAQEVIWNRQIWTPSKGQHPYTGQNPHIDHVHIGQNKAGAAGETPFYTSGAGK